jgi:arabinosaccharide transport system substrate-binding protein
MKWTIIKMLFLLCGLLFLLPGTGTSDADDRRNIRVWTFAQNLAARWEGRKADIESQFNINLEIKLVAQSAFVQKLKAVMQEGRDTPDIIEWLQEGNRILSNDPRYSCVFPLDDFVKDSFVMKNVPDGTMSRVTYGGHVYGLPDNSYPVVLVYNDTLWKAAGVDLEKIKTWDEFFIAAKKLTAQKEGGKPLHYALPTMDSGLTDSMFMIWQQTGAQIFDSTGRPDFANPEFKTFVSKWMSWRASGVFAPWDWGDFAAMLKSGSLAAYPSPDWWVSQVNDAAKDGKYQFKVRPLPVYKEGGPRTASWGGAFLAIPRSERDPQYVYKIMEYMQYDWKSRITDYQSSGLIPPLKSLWDDPSFQQPDDRFGGQRLGRLQTKMAGEMPSITMSDVFWDAIDIFNRHYPDMAAKKIAVREGLEQIQADALKKYNQPRDLPDITMAEDQSNNNRSSERKKTILMWSFATNNLDEWNSRRTEIEKKFNINLQIELVAQNAFLQKLQAVMNEGRGVPDIAEWMVESNKLSADPRHCYAAPLEDFVKNSSLVKAVPAGRVAWVTVGGHVYGLPHDVHPVVLVYNDTLWREAGVDLAAITTWDDFFTAAKKLTAKQEGGKPLHYALPSDYDDYSYGFSNTMFIIWQQTGAQIFDGAGKPTFTSNKFKAFMEKWISWKDTGAFCAWDWGNFSFLLKSGTLCSYPAPDWWVSQVDYAAKEGKYQFRVRPLPAYKEGGPRTSSWGGSFLFMPKTVKDKSYIWNIMEYMQYGNKEIAVQRYKYGGMLAPLPQAWDDPVFHQPDPRFGGQKLGELQVAMAKEMPGVNGSDVFWDALTDFGQQYPEMINKKVSVDEGLQKTQEAVLRRLQ